MMERAIEVPYRCRSCGRSSFAATGECTHCGGVWTEPDITTLVSRLLTDECAAHAALIAAVRACRVYPRDDGMMYVNKADWERVRELIKE